MNERKAVGPDNISATVLELSYHSIVLPLCNIINSSIDDGTYPTVWKPAKVFIGFITLDFSEAFDILTHDIILKN